MDLIERYLAAIGRQLPSEQAGDIKAELRDVLLSRVEEQEEKLGRPLQKAELEALLVDFGNPLAVAGRYRKTQQLIGPEMFPFWWAAVKLMLMIVAGVYLVLILLGMATGSAPSEFERRIPSIFPVMIYLFGIITLGAALFERFGKTGVLQQWKPSRLPPVGSKRRSTFELGTEIGMNIVFIAWWLGAFRFRDILPTPYPEFMNVSLAPVWAVWRWPIVAYSLVEIAANLVAVARPGWTVANAAILAVRYLFGIGILAAILQAGHWVIVSGPTLSARVLGEIQTNFDLGMKAGITLTIIGLAVRIALEGWRARRAHQSTFGAPAVARPART